MFSIGSSISPTAARPDGRACPPGLTESSVVEGWSQEGNAGHEEKAVVHRAYSLKREAYMEENL